jgi:hypothetical protein
VTGGRRVRVFVSGVASVSHLLYVTSFLHELLADHRLTRLTIVDLGLGSFLGAERVTGDDLGVFMPAADGVSLVRARPGVRWRGEAGEELVYLAVGSVGVKPYTRLLLAHRRRLSCIVVDEGLGSYGSARTRWAALRREGRSPVRATARMAAVALMPVLLRPRHWALYERTSRGWRVNERVAAPFRDRVVRFDDPAPGEVVLVSQPWAELGVLTPKRLVQVAEGVVAACREAGLGCRVRPHPAEDASRYAGLEVDRRSGPVELDPGVLQAAVVVGFSSTALINLSALHGTPVVRLQIPELERLEGELSARQSGLLDAYAGPPVPLDGLTARLRLVAASGRKI